MYSVKMQTLNINNDMKNCFQKVINNYICETMFLELKFKKSIQDCVI